MAGFDWLIFGFFLFFAAVSLVSLASIDTFFFNRQVIWFALALIIVLFGSQINWPWFFTQKWFRYGFYWTSILLILVPLVLSKPIRGAKSWIFLGGFQFEPSEIMKIALVILLAGFFSRQHLAAWQGKNILTSFFYAILPAGIVAMQPDLGMAIVILGIWASFILMSGINKKKFFIGLGIVFLTLIFMWFQFLKPYQKDRIIGFISPASDPLGSSYNLMQAKTAIGSAGFFGKGFKGGTQTQLEFLPEAHNDFIFASFVEEWGLLGGVILVLAYITFIVRIGAVAIPKRRNDLKFVALGTVVIFLIQFFINIGSNLGLVPVIGINLPFISYGGSNLLTSAIILSIIERISIKGE